MEDEINFRALLVKLQDTLSDTDRRRLHFLFGNIIPRQLRDDPSVSGTLNLLETLFDRGKINDQDFDILIQAFKQIHCYDIVKRLQAHSRESRKSKHPIQPTTLQNLFDDIDEDKIAMLQHGDTKVITNSNDNSKNISLGASLFKSSEDIKDTNHTQDQRSKLDHQQRFKKCAYRRIGLFTFNILGIIALIVLLVIILIHVRNKSADQQKKCYNQSLCNCNKHTVRTDRIIVGYFTSWSSYIGQTYSVANIPATKLTHINYAYAKIDLYGRITLGDVSIDVAKALAGDNESQELRGNFNQLKKLKEKYKHLRTLISVGGWLGSREFSNVAVNDSTRSIFAKSCVEFIEKYYFDGIDICWFHPVAGGDENNIRRPEDTRNYVLLLKELRNQLNTRPNKTYLLTVATGAVAEQISNLDLSSMEPYVDWINVRTYDFHGWWESGTGHNAPLYQNDNEIVINNDPSLTRNCHGAIQSYIAAKIPTKKIVLGLPLYGRGWQGVNDSRLNGFLQETSHKALSGTSADPAFFSYDHLYKDFIPSYTRYWDNQSKVPFLFKQSTGIWISYDDSESIKWKTDYIKEHQLGGAHFWELGNDAQGKLINATFNALTQDLY